MNSKKQRTSLTMLIFSMLIFSTIGIFRKNIPLSSGFLAFARGIQGSLFLVLFVKLRGRKLFHDIGMGKRMLLIISGALIGLNWMLLFESYNYTTVPVATLCYYMQPTIVILLSPLLFHERLSKRQMVCAIVAILGMVCVSGILEGGIAGNDDLKGIIFGLGAATLYASVVILNKKIGSVDAYEKTTVQLASASMIMIPYLLFTENVSHISWTPYNILMLVIVGILHTGIAYVLYFASMEGLKAQTIAIFSYIDPIGALILAAIFLGEALSVIGMIGAILILGATLISERQ